MTELARHALPGDPAWLKWAFEREGLKEIVGREHNPQIVQWFADVGWAQYKTDETAWCGAFLGAAMLAAGVAIPSIAVRARAWLDWGTPVDEPQRGDVAVFERTGGGHVAIFLGFEGGYVVVLGGNQSNAVTVERKAKQGLLGFRRAPGAVSEPSVHIPTDSSPHGHFARMAPPYMHEFIDAFGLSVDDASAIFGNFGHESLGLTVWQEMGQPAGKGGAGPAQHTATRRRDLEKYLSDHGYGLQSWEGAFDFIEHELANTWEKRAIPAVKKAKTLYDKVVAFEKAYERAGVKHYDSRMDWALRAKAAYLAWLKGGSVSPAPAGSPPGTSPPTKPDGRDVGAIGTGVGAGGAAAAAGFDWWLVILIAVIAVLAVLVLTRAWKG